jgi:alkylated DNA repair dioxygenase AlkB
MELIFESNDKTAFLSKGIFDNYKLLTQCIYEFEPLLDHNPEILIFGKPCNQHRCVGFFSDTSIGYKYSNKLTKSQPLTASMNELIIAINLIMGTEFNGMLVNQYKNGNDYIGPHSDSEIGLETFGVVAISYGAERIFRIRNKYDKQKVFDVNTTHCSILHMGGKFQELYTHEIPKQKKIKDGRFSITFRSHKF